MASKQEIDPEIQQKIRTLQHGDYVRSEMETIKGKTAFLKRAAEIKQTVSGSENRRLNNQQLEKKASIFTRRKEHSPMFSVLTSILIALSVILGGSGITVAAAQSSLPDEPLYNLKLFSEDTLMSLTSNPESQLELALNLFDRRVDEIQEEIAQGEIPTDETQQRLYNQIEKTISLAANLPEDKAITALEKIQLRLLTQQELMAQTQNNGTDTALMVMNQTKVMLQERVMAIENEKANLMQTRQEQQNQFSSETPFDPGQVHSGAPDQQTPLGDSAPMNNSHDATGNNPWTTGTPTPGNGYGPGDGTGDCTTCTPSQNGQTGNNQPTMTPRGNNSNNTGNQNGNH